MVSVDKNQITKEFSPSPSLSSLPLSSTATTSAHRSPRGSWHIAISRLPVLFHHSSQSSLGAHAPSLCLYPPQNFNFLPHIVNSARIWRLGIARIAKLSSLAQCALKILTLARWGGMEMVARAHKRGARFALFFPSLLPTKHIFSRE